MKRLALIAFLLYSALQNSHANAKDLAYMENSAGGRIVVTNEPCMASGRVFDGMNRLYTDTPSGLHIEGCYFIDSQDKIQAVYRDKQQRTYNVNFFIAVEDYKEML